MGLNISIEKIKESMLKQGLRFSFKMASGLPLPFSVLRGAMEIGATIFRPRTDVLIKKIKLKDASTQHIVKAESANPTTRRVIALSWGRFLCGFIQNTSGAFD